MTQAVAWQVQTNDESKLYCLQVEDILGVRMKNKIFKAVDDWSLTGEGYSSKDKKSVLIFTRQFDTIDAWYLWAKQFPFKLQELNRNGKPKAIKLGLDASKKKRKKRRKPSRN